MDQGGSCTLACSCITVTGEPDRDDQGSLGLGLAVAKRLAEAHGGSIAVRSDEATAMTFSLRLPVLSAKEEPESPGTAPSEA